MIVGDAIFPGEVHWGTRCPMFAGDAIFLFEDHSSTRCLMFVGDAKFPGEVHWGTRCPMFVGLDMTSTFFVQQKQHDVRNNYWVAQRSGCVLGADLHLGCRKNNNLIVEYHEKW